MVKHIIWKKDMKMNQSDMAKGTNHILQEIIAAKVGL